MPDNRQKKNRPELQLWEVTSPERRGGRRTGTDRHRTGTDRQSTHRTSTDRQSTHRTGASYRTDADRHRARPIASIRRRRARRRRVILCRCVVVCIFLLFLCGVYKATGAVYRRLRGQADDIKAAVVLTDSGSAKNPVPKPAITVDLLEPNDYSRPQTSLSEVKNIFVHYTANRGTSAAQNRSYFSNLAQTGERSASAHFIIGYEGEILQCIPLDEQAYAVKGRNDDSVSIECCYLSEDGSFTTFTYSSLVDLLAWLCAEYGLTEEDILRHYDEGGKKCPLYYVEHEEEWDKLRSDVGAALMQYAADGQKP